MVLQKVVRITGKVQGVFFRSFCRQQAGKIGGIKGYAKNMPDGSVRVVAQADDEQKLDRFMKQCRMGPLTAKVESCEVVEEPVEEVFEFFDMR